MNTIEKAELEKILEKNGYTERALMALLDDALALNEATEGRIDRHRMLQVLERTERLLLRGLLS